MMTRTRELATGLCLLVLSATGVPAAAANIYATAFGGGATDFDYDDSGTVSALAQGPGGTGFARTRFGVNKAGALGSSSVTEGQPYTTGGGSGESGWAEEMTMTSSRGSGYMFIGLDVRHSLAVTLDGGFANVGLSYSFNASSSTNEYFYLTEGTGGGGTEMSDGTTETVQDLGGSARHSVRLKVPFFSGGTIYVTSKLLCSANATANGPPGSSAFATCDASRSSYWAGVLSVTDLAGAPIDDWTLTSASGTDYRASFVPLSAVPEPASWALLIVGLGATGAELRRRRAAPRIA